MEAVETGERLAARLQLVPLRRQCLDFRGGGRTLPVQVGEILAQRGDLALVRPSENPAAGIVDPMPIVLFVPTARTDLPLTGDGPLGGPELLKGRRALVSARLISSSRR